MKKFENVLIASDFDGTLKNDDGIIEKRDIDAIKYFISEGGYFTVSTGRTYQGFHLYSEEYINAPVLLVNGGMAYDYKTNKTVFLDGIGNEGIEAVNKILKKFTDVPIEMYSFGETFAINLSDQSHRHFTSQGIDYKTIDSPAQAKFPWAKAMIAGGSRSAEIQDFMKNNISSISFLPTSGSYIEVMKNNTDKGTGLMKLAEYLGVSKKNAYAVGDGYNDVDMLTAAAAGFVPCNGSSEALAVATHIVRSNNDGAIENVIEILDKIY